MSNDDRQFFVEHLDSVLQRIGEIVGPLKNDIVTIKDKVTQLETIQADIKTIKAAITDTNKEVHGFDKALGNVEHRLNSVYTLSFAAFSASKKHEKRITKLEQKAA